MTEKRKYLAIIPARGGSKRLPRKNILPLSGKPLIGWSIEAALDCSKIDQVVVTSDDDEVLSIAKQYPIETIKRPAELASDTATTFDAIEHVLKQYSGYEYTVLLQPTSPLRKAEHISEAINKLEELKAYAIVSVCETEHNPLWSNTLPLDGNMNNFIREEIKKSRSQDLPIYYRLNGAIYICKTKELLKNKSFFLMQNIYAYLMNEASSIDIDTKIHWQLADFLIKNEIK